MHFGMTFIEFDDFLMVFHAFEKYSKNGTLRLFKIKIVLKCITNDIYILFETNKHVVRQIYSI